VKIITPLEVASNAELVWVTYSKAVCVSWHLPSDVPRLIQMMHAYPASMKNKMASN